MAGHLHIPLVFATMALAAAPVSPLRAQSASASAAACRSPDAPVREAGFVPLGGIEQWVTITGQRCANPVILFLHGGPGNPLSPFAERLFASWQGDFTLVQWDQRGSGRTFGRNPPADGTPLTIERMTADGLELAEYLVTHLGQPKIVLLGGSWGSILGVHMVKAKPELFHAYVGFSQIVGAAQNQAATYARLTSLAREASDARTLEALEAMGPPPWKNPRNPGILRRATRVYEAKTTDPTLEEWWVRGPEDDTAEMRASAEAGEEYSYLEFVGLEGNGMFTGVDLPALGPAFGVPVFLVQGAEDLVTVPSVTRGFFEKVEAPDKTLVMVPRAGHDPNPQMLAAIHDVLVRRVRPLAQ